MTRPILLLVLLLCCSSGGGGTLPPPPPPPPPPPGDGLRIVMLGNSLTNSNDLAAMISELATSVGLPQPAVLPFAYGNWSLEEHWNTASSMAAVANPATDVVVMQQGPSTLPSSGAHLTEFTGRILTALAPGARAGMYVVWPEVGGNFDGGLGNYVATANAHNTAIYPVGHAIRAVLQDHPEVSVLGGDNFHPGVAGTWLAAIVITSVIYDRDPSTMPSIRPAFIPTAWEAPLRNAAKEAITAYGRR